MRAKAGLVIRDCVERARTACDWKSDLSASLSSAGTSVCPSCYTIPFVTSHNKHWRKLTDFTRSTGWIASRAISFETCPSDPSSSNLQFYPDANHIVSPSRNLFRKTIDGGMPPTELARTLPTIVWGTNGDESSGMLGRSFGRCTGES